MGYISNILGEGRIENVKLADDFTEGGRQYSMQGEIKAMKPQVSFTDLEFAFKTDAINFNAINKSVQMIMSGGFKGFLHTKSGVAKKFKEFFENIGEIGDDITFEELFSSIYRDEMIYGNAFVEKIFNKTEDKIVDLARIDPKKIDYAKTTDDKIILIDGKPLGYSIKLESGTYAEGDIIPEQYARVLKKDADTIFVLSKRICHFKLYAIGDRFYGIGLIEPAYKSGIYKKNIQKGQANSIYQRGFNPIIGYIGNERRMATPADIKGFLAQIKTLDSQRYLALPDWVKVEAVKYEQTGVVNDVLKDLTIDQIAALSAPQALVSGSGEATNRATLSDQRVLWEFTLKDIIKQTISYFKKYILKPINKYNDFGGIPDIEWGELRAEDVDRTSDKIIRILTAKSSHITEDFRNDLEEDLRQIMNIKESSNNKKKKTIMEEQKKDEDNKKQNDLKQKKDIENKLSSINVKLVENITQIKKLQEDKDKLEEKYKNEINELKNNSEEKKFILEKTTKLEENISNKINEVNNERLVNILGLLEDD